MAENDEKGKPENEKEGAEFPRTPGTEHGPSYIPPYDRMGEAIRDSQAEFKTFYERNEKKIKAVAVCGVVYLLHKRALKKVVQKVVSRELDDLTFVMDYTSNPDYRGMAGEKAGVWRLFREL